VEKLSAESTQCVFGYIGTLVDYEGLEILLEAAKALAEAGETRFRVLIVGKGDQCEALKAQARKLDLVGLVEFRPAVPHDEVPKLYQELDVAVFPRRPLPVCEIVSPLKPFEALAMGCPILVSSVAALREIAEDSGNGLVFEKGNANDLAEKMQLLVERWSSGRLSVSRAGRDWVCQRRSWDVLARDLKQLYAELS